MAERSRHMSMLSAMGDALRAKRQKPFSFEKMAALQEELSRVEEQLQELKCKESTAATPEYVEQANLTTEDIFDPAVVHMLTVEMCQLCASGDVVGVRILLDGGADPNGRDYDDRTLLHIASMNGRAAAVNLLLDYGADYTLVDRDGSTAYDVAKDNGHMEVAQTLAAYMTDAEGVVPDSFAQQCSSGTSSNNSPQQPDFSSVPQPMVGSLIVVMVGLPGRGKTYVAQQIRRYFQWNGLECCIYSHQTYRRKAERNMLEQGINPAPCHSTGGAAGAASLHAALTTTSCTSPTATMGNTTFAAAAAVASACIPGCPPTVTAQTTELELRVASELAKDMTKCISHTGGVAILDGTQTTHARRQALLRAIKETGKINCNRVIFVETITNDKETVHQNILRAKEMVPNAPDDFVEKYYAVIARHEAVYKTLSPITDRDLSFIRIEDSRTYSLNMISGWMPSRLAYMLHNLSHVPMNLYLSRPGEYVDRVTGRIGGNSRLTERGRAYSKALFEYFQDEIPKSTTLMVMTSCAKRATQTVHCFAEEAHKQFGSSPVTVVADDVKVNCRVSYFPTLDDINHGDCEGQLIADVRRTMPSTLQAMRADPYYTAWPNGECVHQVFNARLEPHIHDIQASSYPVLVVSHLNLLQGLYSYFVTEEDNAVAPQDAFKIEVPLESVIKIRMVGVNRVAEVIDLSARVEKILLEETGELVQRTVDDPFRLLRRPGSRSSLIHSRRTSVVEEQQQEKKKMEE